MSDHPHVDRQHPARQLYDSIAQAAGRVRDHLPDAEDLSESGIDSRHLGLVRARAAEIDEVARVGDRQGAREVATLAARELAALTGETSTPRDRADLSDPRALADEADPR